MDVVWEILPFECTGIDENVALIILLSLHNALQSCPNETLADKPEKEGNLMALMAAVFGDKANNVRSFLQRKSFKAEALSDKLGPLLDGKFKEIQNGEKIDENDFFRLLDDGVNKMILQEEDSSKHLLKQVQVCVGLGIASGGAYFLNKWRDEGIIGTTSSEKTMTYLDGRITLEERIGTNKWTFEPLAQSIPSVSTWTRKISSLLQYQK